MKPLICSKVKSIQNQVEQILNMGNGGIGNLAANLLCGNMDEINNNLQCLRDTIPKVFASYYDKKEIIDFNLSFDTILDPTTDLFTALQTILENLKNFPKLTTVLSLCSK